MPTTQTTNTIDHKALQFHADTCTLSAEISELQHSGVKLNDTMLVQGKTRTQRFQLKDRRIDADGDVQAWNYECVEVPTIKLVVFND